MAGYHRRSRSGCISCRAARLKCDEERPSCGRCAERGVNCQGYKQRIKWVDHPRGPASLSSPRLVLALQTPLCGVVSAQPIFTSTTDSMLFQYWSSSLLHVSFPNPSGFNELFYTTMAMITEPDSILMPMILASSSAHMAVAGLMAETEMLRRKEKAINTILRALGLHLQAQIRPKNDKVAPLQQTSLDAVDMAICASMHMIGAEVIQGSNMASFVPLLRGAVSLVQRRHEYLQHMPSRFETVVHQDMKLLAWMDLISCVPYPREPRLNPKYWYRKHEFSIEGDAKLDVVLGFAADITLLTGAIATVVAGFFQGKLDVTAFEEAKRHLLESSQICINKLPVPAHVDGSEQSTTRAENNANIWAAVAHGLASQIYLIRSIDDAPDSSQVAVLTSRLEEAVALVPCCSSAMTIMLWPMFVLGCESPAGPLRQTVAERLLEMFAKNNLLNIKGCLATLEEHIWDSHDTQNTNLPTRQAAWVRRCYDERIEPILV